jgi:hypothetical protein
MLARMMLAVCAISALAGCETAATTPPTQPPAPPAADLPAQYARFNGMWSGKWDDTWDVTFVIDAVSSDGQASGHYYWKENVPGPWSHDPMSGFIHGDAAVFGVITITIDPADGNKAVAVGRFELHTRTAKLTKLLYVGG